MPKDSNYENIHNNFVLLPTRFICKRMFFLEEKLYKSVKKNNKDDARQNYLAEFACSLRRNVNANMHNKLRPWKYLAWAGKETFCDRQNFAEGKQISPSFWNTVAKVFFIFWGEEGNLNTYPKKWLCFAHSFPRTTFLYFNFN